LQENSDIKTGRAFMAIRDSEQAAQAHALIWQNTKCCLFYFGLFAGFAGVLFAHTSLLFLLIMRYFTFIYFIVWCLLVELDQSLALCWEPCLLCYGKSVIPLFTDGLAKIYPLEAGEFSSIHFRFYNAVIIIPTVWTVWYVLKIRIYWKLFPFNPRRRST
jgi:hypothetical protein